MRPRVHLACLAVVGALLCVPAPASATVTTLAETSAIFRGLDVDPDGNVYIARSNDGADAVLKYAPDGTLLRTLGRRGTGDGEFDLPMDVAVDDAGHLYVVDLGGQIPGNSTSRLQKLRDDGSVVWSVGIPFQSTGTLVWDPRGFIWAAEVNNRKISRYAVSDGSRLGQWDVGSTDRVPLDVALHPNGDLWIKLSNEGAGSIERRTAEGALVATQATSIWSAQAMTASSDGDVFVAGSDNVERRAAEGERRAVLELKPVLGGDAAHWSVPDLEASAGGLVHAIVHPASGRPRVVRIDTHTPVARLADPAGPVLTGQTVTFDASASRASLGTIDRYQWDLDGDGSFETDSGTSPQTRGTYTTPGDRAVGVRVSVAGGGAADAAVSVSVRPAPPEGAVGVSIETGAQFTNDPSVRLRVVWPSFARTALLSNDGGFAGARSFPVEHSIPWTLDSSGPERLPKTVYLRFDASGTQTYQDDIILDQTAPVVTEAALDDTTTSAVRTAALTPYRLSVKADDATSGVAGVQLAREHGGDVAFQPYRTSYQGDGPPPRWIRVRDFAGNTSEWTPIAGTQAPPQTGPAVRITSRRSRLGELRRNRVTVVVSCAPTCLATARLRVNRSVARRLKVPTTLATARTTTPAARKKIRMRVSRTTAKRLSRARSLRATLVIDAVAPDGGRTRVQRAVTFR